MVKLRFSDSDIFNAVGRTNAIQFLFWLDFDDYTNRDILFKFLSNLKLESCVSPLHDKDEDLGKPKKPHYHVYITAGSGKNKSVRQWFTYIEPIRDFISIAPFDRGVSDLESVAPIWEKENKVHNARGAIRYFKHLDNPEKYQYMNEDYITFGGLDLDDLILSQTDVLIVLKNIYQWIRDNKVYSYAQLVDYSAEHSSEWFYVINKPSTSSNIERYIRSRVFTDSGGIDKYVEKINSIDSESD